MELIKHKEEDRLMDLVLSGLKPSPGKLSSISKVNKQSLTELVNYLTRLKKDEIINDKLFSEFIILACANFIENEVELRISKSINDKIMYHFAKL